jgi:hypothetical protein
MWYCHIALSQFRNARCKENGKTVGYVVLVLFHGNTVWHFFVFYHTGICMLISSHSWSLSYHDVVILLQILAPS